MVDVLQSRCNLQARPPQGDEKINTDTDTDTDTDKHRWTKAQTHTDAILSRASHLHGAVENVLVRELALGEEGEEACSHELQNNERGLLGEDDAQQVQDVGVLEVAHNLGLALKVTHASWCCALHCLDGNLVSVPEALKHGPKLAAANFVAKLEV